MHGHMYHPSPNYITFPDNSYSLGCIKCKNYTIYNGWIKFIVASFLPLINNYYIHAFMHGKYFLTASPFSYLIAVLNLDVIIVMYSMYPCRLSINFISFVAVYHKKTYGI